MVSLLSLSPWGGVRNHASPTSAPAQISRCMYMLQPCRSLNLCPLHAGNLRFWLSAGRGGFGLTTRECLWSSFYVMAYTVPDPPPPQVPHLKGVNVCSSPVPVKDPFSATVKSTNYLINALNLQHAERSGFDQVLPVALLLPTAVLMCADRAPEYKRQ